MKLKTYHDERTARLVVHGTSYIDDGVLLLAGQDRFAALLHDSLNTLAVSMARALAADGTTWEHAQAAFEGALLGLRYKLLLS